MRFRSPKKFNPQLMPKEELYGTFIGREGLLEDILKQIKDQTHKPSIQHFILIGPRGIGKTNLMQMIKYRIQDDAQMKENWFPVVFSEEDFEIYGIRSFFEKIIDLVFESRPSESLLSEFNQIKSLEDDKVAIEKNIEMIEALSGKFKKQFIVFVDNLDSLLMEQLPDGLAVKKLRKFLTTSNSILLFGGAVKVFDEILSYDKPLFSHFAPIELSPLKDGTIEALIKARADYEDNKDIVNDFGKYRPKIKAISDLTGGNPRLILILYDIINEKEFDTAVEILIGILDDLTTYYQDILKNLPPKERKVLDTILRSDIKLTSTNLSSSLRWRQNEISSLLKRLKERQILEGKKASKGREVYYETTDRVFRIFYQMRYLSRQRKRLGFIIDFLQKWYSTEELREKIGEYKSLYEKCLSEDSLEKAFYFADASLKMGLSEPHLDLIKTCINKGNLDKAIEELETWNNTANKSENNKLSYLLFKGGIYYIKKDYTNALKCMEDYVKIDPGKYSAWYNMGNLYYDSKQFDKAVAAYEKVVEFKSDNYEVRYKMGNACVNLKQFDSAVSAFKKAIEIKPNEYEARNNLGGAYVILEQFDNAVSECKKAIKINPDGHDAWSNLGIAYSSLKQHDKAFSAYEKAIEIKPDMYTVWRNKGIAYALLNEFSQSIMAFKEYLVLCKKKEILKKDEINDYFEFFYMRIHEYFVKKEKSRYFSFFKETLDIMKVYKEIDYFSILRNFYTLLLKDSEFSFFNDCFEEVKTVLRDDVYNGMSFFKTAAHYLETKDISILERLNYEERKPVDLILEEVEKRKEEEW